MIDIFNLTSITRFLDLLKPKSDSPKDVDELANKCNSLMSLGKFAKATKCYDKVLELDPYNANTWTKKGDSLLNQRKYHEAIRCYDKAVELDPENAVAWNNKGKSFQNLFGMRFDAIACYDKGLGIFG